MITLQGWCSELGISIGQEHVWSCLLERSSLLWIMMMVDGYGGDEDKEDMEKNIE